jgi:WD40 repeat protein
MSQWKDIKPIAILLVLLNNSLWADSPTHQVLQLAPVGTQTHFPVVTGLAYSAADQLLAAAGDDHAIRLVRIADGSLAKTLHGHVDWVRCLDFSPRGEHLISAGDDARLILWGRASDWNPEQKMSLQPSLSTVRFCPRGEQIAACGFQAELRLLRGKSPTKLQELDEFIFKTQSNDLRVLVFSKDGEQIVVGGRTGVLQVVRGHDMSSVAEIPVHRSRIRGLQFDGRGSRLYSCAEDGTVVATELQSGKRVGEVKIPGCKLQSIAALEGDLLATGGTDNMIHIVDILQGRVLKSWEGHSGSVAAMVVCGTKLATASFDTTIRLWDLSLATAPEPRVAVDAGEVSTKPSTEARLPPTTTPR